jgi:hypothetical protein
MKDLKYLFFMPSFYGFASFFLPGVLYLVKVFQYEETTMAMNVVFVLTCVCMVTSMVFFLPLYARLLGNSTETPASTGRVGVWTQTVLLVGFTIGFYGVAKYTLDVSAYLGGVDIFFLTLFSDQTLNVRGALSETTSSGIQLTYLGWMAATFATGMCSQKRLGNVWLWPVVLTLLSNLLFIDRTRPFWLLLTTGLFVLPSVINKLDFGRLFQRVTLAALMMLGLFNLIGNTIGKVNVEGRFGPSIVPLSMQNMVFYATSGYAYLNRLFIYDQPGDYVPRALTYPLGKLLNNLGLAPPPPEQVLEFYYMPFSTNVGTFLEPYYHDGGLLYVVFGILIHSFLMDMLSLKLLKHRENSFAIYLWANLCFANTMACFTPKIFSLPIWLFAISFVVSYLIDRYRQLAVEIRQAT